AVETEPLRQVADRRGQPAMIADRVEIEDAYAARVDRQQPADQPDRRRLAGASGPDEAEHLAALDGNRQRGDGSRRSVPFGHALERNRHAPRVIRRPRRHCSGISASTGIPALRTPARLSTDTLTR